ncbi:MAG: CrcB family protein [Leptolyngbya sp. SIO1E4]|nr:CrcB family protein [Leptolyngbya sp. SIO1E4]
MFQDPHLRGAIAVALGAIAGALGRYYVTLGCTYWFGSSVYGTLLVNLAGAWVMGFFTTLMALRVLHLPQEVILLVSTGFLGSLTTFSTYTLDTMNLAGVYTLRLSLLYWLGTAVCGVISLYGGIFTARLLQ